MSLTEEQQRFLHRYINNKGDFYKTVESMGLDIAHITSWQNTNTDFALNFKAAKSTVIDFLKHENYMYALIKVNDALMHGVTQTTETKKHKIGGEGGNEGEYEITHQTKNLGVPAWAIKEALQETSVVKAIQTLAAEGVLPTEVARKIISYSDNFIDKVRNSFEIASEDENFNEAKAVALIKKAVLGVMDE